MHTSRHEQAQSVPGTAFVVVADRVRRSLQYVALRGALEEKLLATFLATEPGAGFRRQGGAKKMAEVALAELCAACPEAQVEMGSHLIPTTVGRQLELDLAEVRNAAVMECNRRWHAPVYAVRPWYVAVGHPGPAALAAAGVRDEVFTAAARDLTAAWGAPEQEPGCLRWNLPGGFVRLIPWRTYGFVELVAFRGIGLSQRPWFLSRPTDEFIAAHGDREVVGALPAREQAEAWLRVAGDDRAPSLESIGVGGES
jgi:hypothetical protein